jgi:hypothetical protein
MSKDRLGSVIVAALCVPFGLAPAGAQEPAKPPAGAEAHGPEDAAKPGPVHERLAKRAGEYTTATKFTMAPGAQPVETTGTAKLKVVLGGRFLHEENAGSMMGQAYEGGRLWGYNNGTKLYEAVWTYTNSTSMLTMTGKSDDGGKTVIYKGSYDEGGGPERLTITVKEIDADRFSIEIKGEGEDAAVMESLYTRKK